MSYFCCLILTDIRSALIFLLQQNELQTAKLQLCSWATLWADLQSAMRETRMQDRINYWRPEPSPTTLLIWVTTTFTRVRGRSLAYLSVCVLLACVHLHIQNPRDESESQKLHSIKRMREKASPAEWFHIPICVGKSLSLLTLTVCPFAIWKTPGEGGVELRVQSVFLHREPADLCYKSTPTFITNIIFFSECQLIL